MTQSATERLRRTTADLELLPNDGNRYETIDGDLFVTRPPHWGHQETCGNIYTELRNWSRRTGLGRAAIAPGIIFVDTDNVIPDVVWAGVVRAEPLMEVLP